MLQRSILGARLKVAIAFLCAVCIASCDEQPRVTACKVLSGSDRVSFAREELRKYLVSFAAGGSVKEINEHGHSAHPADFAGVRADELDFVEQVMIEGDLEMEGFDFRTTRAPGFRWMISLYDTSKSGYEECPSDFHWRWDGG